MSKRAKNPVSVSEQVVRDIYEKLGLDYDTGLPKLSVEDMAWLALADENNL